MKFLGVTGINVGQQDSSGSAHCVSKLAQVNRYFGVTDANAKHLDTLMTATRDKLLVARAVGMPVFAKKKKSKDSPTRWVRIKIAPLGGVSRPTARTSLNLHHKHQWRTTATYQLCSRASTHLTEVGSEAGLLFVSTCQEHRP